MRFREGFGQSGVWKKNETSATSVTSHLATVFIPPVLIEDSFFSRNNILFMVWLWLIHGKTGLVLENSSVMNTYGIFSLLYVIATAIWS